MADSIDRVFAHALQTVRKLPRTGSARPPTNDRLRLYGLYKQSMEGDVEGVMARPTYSAAELASSAEARAELEKWEAWAGCAGLTRTQAKTKYIDTLIATMHAYASGTVESRALVQELEFVWDQVRSNAAAGGLVEEEREQRERGRRRPSRQGSSRSGTGTGRGSGRGRRVATEGGLRVLRPMSEDADSRDLIEEEDEDGVFDEDDADRLTQDDETDFDTEQPVSTRRWQSRMESAVVRLTAEVAAVREQLDGANHSFWTLLRSSRLAGSGGGFGPGGAGAASSWARFIVWRAWLLVRRLVMDALAVAVVLALWRTYTRVRRRGGGAVGDPRLYSSSSSSSRSKQGGLDREMGALREGIEMVEAWLGFWWARVRRGLSLRSS